MAAETPDLSRREARVQLLAHAGFDVGPDALAALADDFTAQQLCPGDYLFHEGDPGNRLLVVATGLVEAVTTNTDGRELVFRAMGAGSIIGELTIVDGANRSAGVRATEPSSVIGISRRAFLRHAHRRPEIGLALAQLCARRALDLSQWASSSSFSSLESRLAATLLTLRLGADTTAVPVISITQQALGDRLGVSRESVNKWLRSWERDGVVELGRNRITVRDTKHLEALALS